MSVPRTSSFRFVDRKFCEEGRSVFEVMGGHHLLADMVVEDGNLPDTKARSAMAEWSWF